MNTKELQAGSRCRAVGEARAVIAFRSIEELGLTTAEIARAHGVATFTSSIRRPGGLTG